MSFIRWRRPLTSIVLAVIMLGTLLPPLPALAASGDTTADAALGQKDLTTGSANSGSSVGPAGLSAPEGVVVDPISGRVYVSDFNNNRVLGWPDAAAYATGQEADLVLGQANFTAHSANRGGSLSALTLASPAGLAVDDRTGSLFVADYGNNRILVYAAPVTSGEAASQVFGQGGSFTTGGANTGGISANSLNSPRGLAVDDAGYLYVADSLNHRVLAFSHDGDTTADFVLGQNNHFNTGAANGGGAVSASGFNLPLGVATYNGFGGGGQNLKLAVSDQNNHRVLIFSSPNNAAASAVYGQGGSFTAHTFNNGGPSANSLFDPRGVVIDSARNLYVADYGNHRVLRFAFVGGDTTADSVLGQGGSFTTTVANKGGPVSANTLFRPTALAVDPAQNLLVVDSSNHRVLRFDRPQNNPPAPPSIRLAPSVVALNGASFNLLVSGLGFVKGTVVQWNGSDRPTTFISPNFIRAAITAADINAFSSGTVTVINPGPGGGSIQSSVSLYFGLGHDVVADAELGEPDFTSTRGNQTQVQFLSARSLELTVSSVAVDPHSGRLYVADTGNNRVLSWPNATAFGNDQPADKVLGQADLFSGAPGSGSARLNAPRGLAVDASGNVYVADTNNNRVVEFNTPAASDAVADRVFGQASLAGTAANYSGVNALGLSSPFAVALDPSGKLFVADSFNSRILIYDAPLTSDATADAVLGQAGFTNSAPNRGNADPTALSLVLPGQMSFDTSGRLYAADTGNNRVLAYPAGAGTGSAASAVFGQPNLTSGAANNPSLGPSSLAGPVGVAVDADGNVYIGDSSNNRVLEFDQPLAPGGNFSADRVFGQANFTTNTANASDDASETRLSAPNMLALDAQANLFVADSFNARLLQYLTPVAQKLRLYLPLTRR